MCVGGRHGGVVGDSLDLFAGENSKANFETYFCVCRQQKTEVGSSCHIALFLSGRQKTVRQEQISSSLAEYRPVQSFVQAKRTCRCVVHNHVY